MSAPSVRSLAFSAFRAGGLVAFRARPSGRSFSGAVAVVSFSSPAARARFARRWSVRLGVPVFCAGRCGCRVPVDLPSVAAWSGAFVAVSGGLPGLVAGLAAAGFPRV